MELPGTMALNTAVENGAGRDADTGASILDIAEGVISAIYSHQEAAEKLGDRVPPRKAPPRAPGDK